MKVLPESPWVDSTYDRLRNFESNASALQACVLLTMMCTSLTLLDSRSTLNDKDVGKSNTILEARLPPPAVCNFPILVTSNLYIMVYHILDLRLIM